MPETIYYISSEDPVVEYVPQEGPENTICQGNKEKTSEGGADITKEIQSDYILQARAGSRRYSNIASGSSGEDQITEEQRQGSTMYQVQRGA